MFWEAFVLKKSDKLFVKVMTHLLAASIGACVVLGLFVFLGILPVDSGLTKLEQLQMLIEERFVGTVDTTAMEDAAADAMVNAMGDRWSYYIPASEYGAYMEQMTNTYVGVGITVQYLEDGSGIEVRLVNKGGPAEDAGMLYGDVIVAVDGVQITEENMENMSSAIKGEEGTFVELTVLRGDEMLTLSVERRQIQVAVAQGRLLPGRIGLVTIANFDERCAEETIAAVEQLLGAGVTGLIFDVRNNPGGYKKEMVNVLDYILPEGPIFRSEDYKGNEMVDSSDAEYLDIPMVVLVNSESYSAAEFFAVTLSEYGVAKTVGTQTSGKGYFQQVYKLLDGSAVGLSVGRYYAPSGKSLEGVGVTPDVVVEVDEETFAKIYAGILPPEEDPQILAALKLLTEN